MIVLDTNVISACTRPASNRAVIDWLDRQPPESLWTTAVNLFELRYGIEALAVGASRDELEAACAVIAGEIFAGRVLMFDEAAANAAAALAGRRRQTGREVEFRDTFIAGICLSAKARLATRNTRDFFDAGVSLVDPWKEGAA